MRCDFFSNFETYDIFRIIPKTSLSIGVMLCNTMKKILLIIAYILIWIISAQGAPKTIKKTFPKGSGFIEVSGYFEKGELTTGPLKVWYESTKNGITRVLLEGHYNAELAQFRGTFNNNYIGNSTTFFCLCTISNNDTKDKILVKNLIKDKWHISIQQLSIYKYENSGHINSVRLLINDYKQTYNDSINLNTKQLEQDVNKTDETKKYMYQTESSSLRIFSHDFLETNVEITFKNGNKCIGPQVDYDVIDKDGIYEYIWSNGDKYIGLIYPYNNNRYNLNNYRQIYPKLEKGEFVLADGSIISHKSSLFSWHQRIVFNNDLHINTTPCQSFRIAQKRIEEERKKEEEERLQKIREEEERRAMELRAKQEEERNKIARKNYLISKYGQKYGEAIFNKVPLIGMTIEMVQLMHNTKGHRSHLVLDGKEVLVLTYGGDYYSIFGISGVTAKTEYLFVNGRLVEYMAEDGQASIF